MKSLHIINSLALGGAERLLSDLLPRLALRGVSCCVLALDRRGDAYSDTLESRGIPVYFARPGGSDPFSPLRVIDILDAIRREKPDVVHAHLGPSFHWCAVASFLLRKPVYIATEHASINRRMAKPHLRGLERLCYSRYENIACVSQSAGAAIQAWIGLSPERLKVIPNGVDLARFTSSSHKGDPSSTIHGAASHVIVSVGRLVAAKDYNTALRALSILPHDYTLAIAGDGPERTGLEALAVELKLGDRMRFLGAREDIPAVLATGCVYLQSSRAEGFGIAVIEAMAAGVPVVASRVAGLESIVEGVGFLFNAGDAAECAACLRRMCEDATTCKNARLEGVRRAGEFSIERSADMYVELYTSMLRERAGI